MDNWFECHVPLGVLTHSLSGAFTLLTVILYAALPYVIASGRPVNSLLRPSRLRSARETETVYRATQSVLPRVS